MPATSAEAHSIHADCRVGRSWMGVGPHYHPGSYGRAVRCDPRAVQRDGQDRQGEPPARKYYEIEPPRGPGQRPGQLP